MTLYVTDLDGTLLRSDMTISQHSINTINRLIDEGVMFTYATARSYVSASPLVSNLRQHRTKILQNSGKSGIIKI